MTGAHNEALLPEKLYDLTGKRTWVAGHRGMVGSAIVRRLGLEDVEFITAGREHVDLTRQEEVERFMARECPQIVILAAAKVGGILANANDPTGFLYDNLMIAANVLRASYENGVERLLYLGSSCIYPKHALQPIPESALLTGALEPTNEGYAIAKIAGLRLAHYYRRQHGADFIAAMPTNLYGPNDNYDQTSSHVLPALLRRIDEAKRNKAPRVVIWGTGRPRREFLHVDDLADACVHLLERYDGLEHVNIGRGGDVSITDLASLIAEIVGYEGELTFDASKPDGTPRKLLDCSRLSALGWQPKISLREGVSATYCDYLKYRSVLRGHAPA